MPFQHITQVNGLQGTILRMLFVAGDVLNKYYFPVFIPVGITGNILSLMVSAFSMSRFSPHDSHPCRKHLNLKHTERLQLRQR